MLLSYLALNISDSFLSLSVNLFTWIITLVLLFVVLRRINAETEERAVSLMGICALSIFAAQMLNFTYPWSNIRTPVRGTLAGIILGPWRGTLVVAIVFIVQAV